jgi:Leucine-rich repeat (LRR) protein
MLNVKEMRYMFNGASSFNQSLCSWPMSLDINQVTLTGIFSFSGCSETITPGAASDNWCQPCQNSSSTDCQKECQELLVEHADPRDELEFQQAIMNYLMEEANPKCCSFLHLSGFQLTGTLSTEIGMLTNLVELDLHLNSLTGELPTELGLLTQLSYLDLANNEFNGTLPVEISNLQSLEILNLRSNVLLSGTIPNVWADLISLQDLYLGNTSLEGEVDASICENMYKGMLN